MFDNLKSKLADSRTKANRIHENHGSIQEPSTRGGAGNLKHNSQPSVNPVVVHDGTSDGGESKRESLIQEARDEATR